MNLQTAIDRVVADTHAEDGDRTRTMTTSEILAEVRSGLDHEDIGNVHEAGLMDDDTAAAYRAVLNADDAEWSR